MKFLTDILAKAGLTVEGVVTLNNTASATVNTNKFVVLDGSVVKVRTAAQVLADIGAQATLTNPITGTGTSGQVAYFNGTNSLTSSATFAFTPTSQLLVNNSVTAASAIAIGTNLTPTLTAAANSDVLVGLDINPTFVNSAFTGVQNIGLRVQGSTIINSGLGNVSTNAFQITGSGGSLLRLRGFGDLYLEGGSANLIIGSSNYGGGNANIFSSAGTGTSFFRVVHNNGNNAIRAISNGVVELNPVAGNVLVGTTTDAGYKLDVNGNTRVQSALTVGNGVDIQAGLLRVRSNSAAGTGFVVSEDNGYVLRNSNWNYDRTSLNTWIGGSQVTSSLFTINSTTQGILPPRMTTTQRDAISSPATGLQVYNTTTNTNDFYNGSAWASGASGTYVTSVTGTSPIVSSGGTTPAISIPVATTSVNGYLSSTDWTTFNNKQAALTNPVTGTGTAGQIALWSGTLTQNGSADFTWDDTNKYMVANLGLSGYVKYGSNSGYNPGFVVSAYSNFLFSSNARYNGSAWIYDKAGYASQFQAESNTGIAAISTAPIGAAGATATMTQRFYVTNAGRILLGPTLPTDDTTSALQVNGTIKQTSVTSSLLKTDSTGKLVAAVSGTDYVIPSALNVYLLLTGGTLTGALNGTSAVFSSNVAVNTTSPYSTSVYSLDINGGLLVKNTGRAASITLINADPSAGGNNAFVNHTVGGTLTASYANIQTYYGASVAGGIIKLQQYGGTVSIWGQLNLANYTTSTSFTGTAVATLAVDSSGNVLTVTGSGGTGTVTSIATSGTVSGITLTGGIITTTGTITLGGTLAVLPSNFASQTANTILAGPTTGVAAAPTFRTLVAADIPSLSGSYLPLSAGASFPLTGNLVIQKTAPNISMKGGYTQDLAFFLNSEPSVYLVDDATATKGIKVNISTGAFNQLGGGAVTLTGALSGTSATFSGNVGIGITPTNTLHLYKASGTISITLQTGTSYGYLINDATNIGLGSDVGSTGFKLLVNRNSPDNSLVIASTGAATFSSSVQTTDLRYSGSGYLTYGTGTVGTETFIIRNGAASPALTIVYGGAATFSSSVTSVGLYTSQYDPSEPGLQIKGTYDNVTYKIGTGRNGIAYAGLTISNSTAGINMLSFSTTGAATFSSTISCTALTETSTIKIKENIVNLDSALTKIDKLQGVSYNRIGSTIKEIGLIAEAVEEIYPEFVQYDEKGEPVGLHYSRLTAVLIESVKELKLRIEQLENK